MKTLLYPLKLGSMSIVFGVALIAIQELTNMPTLFSLPWMTMLGLLLISVSLVTFGIKAIRYYGFTKKGLITPLFGLIAFTLTIFASFYSNNTLTNPSFMEHMVEVINNDATPLKRKAWLSKHYAREYYLKHEKNIEYYTESGERKLYVPAKEDFKLVELTKQATQMGDMLLIFAYICVAGLILSLLFAFFSPLKLNNESD